MIHTRLAHLKMWSSALLFVLVLLCPALAGAGETVRVLVSEGRTTVTVGGGAGFTLSDTSGGRVFTQRPQGGTIRLANQRGAVAVRETGHVAPAVLAYNPDRGPVAVDGILYRGYLEVHAAGGALAVVNVVDLEAYLQGVVKDEIPAGWPAETAKAMAVAARTYAAYQRRQNPTGLFHLRNTTASQVYGGARGEDPRTTWAVQTTQGQVLTFQDQPIPAFYHSCSGGATEDAADYFGQEYDIVLGVKDDFSLGCPYALWVERLTTPQIEQALARAGHAIGRVQGIQDLLRSRTGRILRIGVQHTRGTLVLEGRRFREAIGNEVLRSTDFEVRADRAGYTFVGRGSGHGVGMSQWGAKEMADLAFQYQDILKFYYPVAVLGRLR
jgi:stage II sporulation protein D